MKPSIHRLKFLLSFGIFVLLILLFFLPSQQRGSAEFFISLITIGIDSIYLFFVIRYIRKNRSKPEQD